MRWSGCRARCVFRRLWGVLAFVGALAGTGCPEEPPPSSLCADRAADLQASNRDGATPLADGDLVEVFLPPQGGVFTELDVVMSGIEPTAVVSLRTTFVTDDGLRLADQEYPGNALEVMLACRPDGWFYLDNMPVRFGDQVVLEELDGVSAIMSIALEADDDELDLERRVVFSVVDY